METGFSNLDFLLNRKLREIESQARALYGPSREEQIEAERKRREQIEREIREREARQCREAMERDARQREEAWRKIEELEKREREAREETERRQKEERQKQVNKRHEDWPKFQEEAEKEADTIIERIRKEFLSLSIAGVKKPDYFEYMQDGFSPIILYVEEAIDYDEGVFQSRAQELLRLAHPHYCRLSISTAPIRYQDLMLGIGLGLQRGEKMRIIIPSDAYPHPHYYVGHLGSYMRGGKIEILSSKAAYRCIGLGMKGGLIDNKFCTVVGQHIGENMFGGEIIFTSCHVFEGGDGHLGRYMHGGSISINQALRYHIGENMSGGQITINGACDPLSIGKSMSGGTIIIRGQLVHTSKMGHDTGGQHVWRDEDIADKIGQGMTRGTIILEQFLHLSIQKRKFCSTEMLTTRRLVIRKWRPRFFKKWWSR